MAGDLTALAAESGAAQPVIVWNGKTFSIFPNLAENQQVLGSGGFSNAFVFNFTAVAVQFFTAAFPDVTSLAAAMVNTYFGYLGGQYKVTEVKILSGGTVIGVVGNAAAQGA